MIFAVSAYKIKSYRVQLKESQSLSYISASEFHWNEIPFYHLFLAIGATPHRKTTHKHY